MKKIIKRGFIFILFLLTTIGNFYISIKQNSTILANNNYNIQSKNKKFFDEVNEKSKLSNIFEIETLREKDVKHFRLEDGTYRAVSYGKTVHRKDSSDKWQDIDNRLVLNNGKYRTNDGKMKFLKVINNTEPFFEIIEDDYTISYQIINENTISADSIISNDTDFSNNEEITSETLSRVNTNSRIKYLNVYNNVDLECILDGENTVTKITSENYINNQTFTFLIKLKNLIPRLDEDNTLTFINRETEGVEFRVLSPIGVTTDGDTTQNIEYNLIEITDEEYGLSIIVDSFKPLQEISINKIGGDIIIPVPGGGDGGGTGNPEVFDTYISSSNPNMNYGLASEIKVSINSTNIGLIKLRQPYIPDGSTIVDAFMKIPYYYDTASSKYIKLGAYEILSDWSETAVKWNDNVSISSTQLSAAYTFATATESSIAYVHLGIVDAVDSWYVRTTNNYGIAVKYEVGNENTVKFKSWENNAECTTMSIDYNMSNLIIDEDTYYIRNIELDECVQIDNNDSGNNYNSQGAILELWDWRGHDIQKWIFEYLHNGYYAIKSYKSNLVISVDEEDVDSGGHALIQETYNGSHRQQWKITVSSQGNYIIKARSSERYTPNRVMCAGFGLGSSGRNVEQLTYENNTSYRDEWDIIPISDKRIVLCGITNEYHDHASYLEKVKSAMFRDGFENIELFTGTVTAYDCLFYLKSSKIFISRSHGTLGTINKQVVATGINLNDYFNQSMVALFSDNCEEKTQYSLSISNEDNFSNLELALFIACSTGYGGENAPNLPSKVVSQGAGTAVGFASDISCSAANEWVEQLYKKLRDGLTIGEASQKLAEVFPPSSGMQNYVICGNKNYKL